MTLYCACEVCRFVSGGPERPATAPSNAAASQIAQGVEHPCGLCSGAIWGEHASGPGCSGDPVGPGPELLALLDRLRLNEWASFLAKCGAVEIDDLRWIDEGQLVEAGMLIVPCRKLRAAALGDEAGARAAIARARLAAALDGAGPDNGSCVNCGFPHSSAFSRDSSRHAADPMPPQLVGPGAPIDIRVAVGDGDEHPTSGADPDMARLAFTARQARETARTSLAAALMAREPLSEEVVTCLIYAKEIADHSDAPPRVGREGPRGRQSGSGLLSARAAEPLNFHGREVS